MSCKKSLRPPSICSIQSIKITPAKASIAINATQQYTAIGTFSNGSTGDITTLVTWNSSNSSTATIKNDGLATGIARGKTAITASLPASCAQTVTSNIASLAVGTRFYISNYGNNTISVFDAEQFKTSGSPIPIAIITVSDSPGGITFDENGNLWVTSNYITGTTIVQYTLAQLETTGTPVPNVIISANGGSIYGPFGITFDASGNLWVGNYDGSTIVKYTPTQLSVSGSPVPNVTISGIKPELLTFDSSGNLWVPVLAGSTVNKFTPAQLEVSGSPTPDVIISANSGSLNGPNKIAFDSLENMWVTNYANTLVQYTPAQFETTGNPIPNITISANGGSLNGSNDGSFDGEGNLWVSNYYSNTLVQFTPNQLMTTGSPSPNITISANGASISSPYAFAIYPLP